MTVDVDFCFRATIWANEYQQVKHFPALYVVLLMQNTPTNHDGVQFKFKWAQ